MGTQVCTECSWRLSPGSSDDLREHLDTNHPELFKTSTESEYTKRCNNKLIQPRLFTTEESDFIVFSMLANKQYLLHTVEKKNPEFVEEWNFVWNGLLSKFREKFNKTLQRLDIVFDFHDRCKKVEKNETLALRYMSLMDLDLDFDEKMDKLCDICTESDLMLLEEFYLEALQTRKEKMLEEEAKKKKEAASVALQTRKKKMLEEEAKKKKEAVSAGPSKAKAAASCSQFDVTELLDIKEEVAECSSTENNGDVAVRKSSRQPFNRKNGEDSTEDHPAFDVDEVKPPVAGAEPIAAAGTSLTTLSILDDAERKKVRVRTASRKYRAKMRELNNAIEKTGKKRMHETAEDLIVFEEDKPPLTKRSKPLPPLEYSIASPAESKKSEPRASQKTMTEEDERLSYLAMMKEHGAAMREQTKFFTDMTTVIQKMIADQNRVIQNLCSHKGTPYRNQK